MLTRIKPDLRSGSVIAAVAILALYSCGRAPETQQTAPAESNPPAATVAAPVVPASPAVPAADQDTVAVRRAELQAQIEAVQSQHGTLVAERERLAALVQTHQREGDAKLADFKTQLKGAQAGSASDRERLAEQARNELETALMMDQEYQAQLADATAKVRESDETLEKMRAELAGLESDAPDVSHGGTETPRPDQKKND